MWFVTNVKAEVVRKEQRNAVPMAEVPECKQEQRTGGGGRGLIRLEEARACRSAQRLCHRAAPREAPQSAVIGPRLLCRAMGSKKKELALQVNISTQEHWEEMLSSKGLTVVDVYQAWCGPCKPVVSLFQKMRIEVGLDLLHFALAEADRLDVLEQYRGRCEPTFLFYAGGELVSVVRGANAPLLQKTILDQLEAEKKVLAEGGQRKVIKDAALCQEDEWLPREKHDGEDKDVVASEKTCTLAIIKPDAVVHGKTDEIIMKELFEKLVRHLCSGPSHLLILTRTEGTDDVVTAWRALMGPCDPNMARKEQPESLRAQYGTEMPFNALHGSRDRGDAHRELALLFPRFKFSEGDVEAPQGPSLRLAPAFSRDLSSALTHIVCPGLWDTAVLLRWGGADWEQSGAAQSQSGAVRLEEQRALWRSSVPRRTGAKHWLGGAARALVSAVQSALRMELF
ncbi:Thioredoxin domain-containing protein 6 [Tupaia chinensis]|uniref:Thioredoxin domain-containing protein 6 n=1 Tax=Tupaia chinensis TaxID=246437 RepID=L9JHN2_TUPCH|nr:Thioredoxin domain-containing protein 6 [Tupaia chinensis]